MNGWRLREILTMLTVFGILVAGGVAWGSMSERTRVIEQALIGITSLTGELAREIINHDKKPSHDVALEINAEQDRKLDRILVKLDRIEEQLRTGR